MIISLLGRLKVFSGRNGLRCFCQLKKASEIAPLDVPPYFHLGEALRVGTDRASSLVKSMVVHEDFLSADEEKSILDEIEPYMTNMHYEFDHWDDAIHGYRETERLEWNEKNTAILDRVRSLAFPPEVPQLKFVHILDLNEKGVIKPHIDAVRFCGNTIAGLSLLTDSVMRLVNEKRKELFADVLLKRRSLYIMNGTARYEYTHEILSDELSRFGYKRVPKGRRISVICRNEPEADIVQ